ncbi:MAG: hypothetical protein A370_04701 [Clostridium sp. Maddingley MBC34-26]|nr:MAG: hypothetical protein A370_04701 [Clostridium sp. Maddingley MBC34-26]
MNGLLNKHKGKNKITKIQIIKYNGGGLNMEEILEYEIKYPSLDIMRLIKDRKLFDYEMIYAHVKEYQKGFKVKVVSKTYKSGTNFTYVKINNKDELKEYKGNLIGMIEEYNEKYNEKITLEDITL